MISRLLPSSGPDLAFFHVSAASLGIFPNLPEIPKVFVLARPRFSFSGRPISDRFQVLPSRNILTTSDGVSASVRGTDIYHSRFLSISAQKHGVTSRHTNHSLALYIFEQLPSIRHSLAPFLRFASYTTFTTLCCEALPSESFIHQPPSSASISPRILVFFFYFPCVSISRAFISF